MKKLLLAALLMTGISTFAQQLTKAGIDQPRKEKVTVETRVKKLTDELKLDQKQELKVTTLLTEQEKAREDIKERTKAAGTDLAAKAALRNEMKEQGTVLKSKMKEILTPDQFTKWEASTKPQRRLPASAGALKEDGPQINETDKKVLKPTN